MRYVKHDLILERYGGFMLFNIFVISISLSIDALAIGISYYLKGVRITTTAKLIIGAMSAIAMLVSLQLGNYLMLILPTEVMKILGVSLLILIGIVFIRNSLFGIPEAIYDFDKSANIEWIEALVLGVALSVDTMSAGVAIAAIGFYHMAIPIMVGMMQMLFLYIGAWVVQKSNVMKKGSGKACGVFSGVLLIIIAILRGIAG